MILKPIITLKLVVVFVLAKASNAWRDIRNQILAKCQEGRIFQI